VIEHEQIRSRRQQDLERLRRPLAEVRGDIDVGPRTVRASGAAAVQVSKARPGAPQHRDRLGDHRTSLVHVLSLSDP